MAKIQYNCVINYWTLCKNLDQLYLRANLENKQKMISSIFPGKIIFDGNKCRTERLNEMISLIISTDKGFDKKKARQHSINPMLSGLVEPAGVEPSSTTQFVIFKNYKLLIF